MRLIMRDFAEITKSLSSGDLTTFYVTDSEMGVE
jgi:hypothetical protein